MSRKQAAEESCQVPVWIITFSDMTTNLLTFFVLLVSMGHIRDDTMFDIHEGTRFLESVKMGFGFKPKVDLGGEQIKYAIKDGGTGTELITRTIDAREENIRRVFNELSQSMTAVPSRIDDAKQNFLITDIVFSHGQSELNETAEKFLAQFAMNLQRTDDSEEIKLYVLGLADDAGSEKEQWLLSARRARAVADFLNDVLPAERARWIYSWGAGPGGAWADETSPVSRQSQILIAVLGKND